MTGWPPDEIIITLDTIYAHNYVILKVLNFKCTYITII